MPAPEPWIRTALSSALLTFARHCGRQAVLDRLCEVLIIRLLRHCIDRKLTQGDAGGPCPQPLVQGAERHHADPARDWSLATMATLAGMSRPRLAVRFKQVSSETPAACHGVVAGDERTAPAEARLAAEIGRVRGRLRQCQCVNLAFQRNFGCTPSEWLEGRTGRTDHKPRP